MTKQKPAPKKMTPKQLERERAALLAILETDAPMTDELKARILAVAKADMARPRSAFDEAFAEVIGEAVALSPEPLPPGLDFRVDGETIQILSRGRVISTVARRALLDRTTEIEVKRILQASHGPN